MRKVLRRFWREWGFSKEDLGIIAGGLGVAGAIASLYMLMWLAG